MRWRWPWRRRFVTRTIWRSRPAPASARRFGYLLPAIEQVIHEKRRVVVSTHTIALQEQLIQKDIPTLQAALRLDFKAELVKGRGNYVGLRRLQQASQRQKTLFNTRDARSTLHMLEDWAYETGDGSLSDLTEAPPMDVWEKVRSERGNCLGRRCPTYEQCFYQRARRRAEAAGILVVNHALLVSDLVLRRDGASVLPDYDLVVVDEAHTLDQVATDHFGTSVAASQVQYLLSGLFNDRTGKGFSGGDRRRCATAGGGAGGRGVYRVFQQPACLAGAARAQQRAAGGEGAGTERLVAGAQGDVRRTGRL